MYGYRWIGWILSYLLLDYYSLHHAYIIIIIIIIIITPQGVSNHKERYKANRTPKLYACHKGPYSEMVYLLMPYTATEAIPYLSTGLFGKGVFIHKHNPKQVYLPVEEEKEEEEGIITTTTTIIPSSTTDTRTTLPASHRDREQPTVVWQESSSMSKDNKKKNKARKAANELEKNKKNKKKKEKKKEKQEQPQ